MNNEGDKELLSKMRSARQQNAGTSSQPQGDWLKEESEIDKSQFDAEVIASRAQSTDPLTGKVLFGTYKVESVIGEGAMGIVYTAKQLAFNRHVALKTIKTNDPAISSRFTQLLSNRRIFGQFHNHA